MTKREKRWLALNGHRITQFTEVDDKAGTVTLEGVPLKPETQEEARLRSAAGKAAHRKTMLKWRKNHWATLQVRP